MICAEEITVVEKLGGFVRRERKKRSLSQAALGQLVGVDGQTISNLENGHTQSLKPTKLRKLAEVFGVDPAMLVALTEPRAPLTMEVTIRGDDGEVHVLPSDVTQRIIELAADAGIGPIDLIIQFFEKSGKRVERDEDPPPNLTLPGKGAATTSTTATVVPLQGSTPTSPSKSPSGGRTPPEGQGRSSGRATSQQRRKRRT